MPRAFRCASFPKRVFDPYRYGVRLDEHRIEPASRHRPLPREIVARRGDQTRALALGDAFRRSAEGAVAPHAHFDEHESRAIGHDEIDLAKATAIVACFEMQPVAAQESERLLLRLRAGIAHARIIRGGGPAYRSAC